MWRAKLLYNLAESSHLLALSRCFSHHLSWKSQIDGTKCQVPDRWPGRQTCSRTLNLGYSQSRSHCEWGGWSYRRGWWWWTSQWKIRSWRWFVWCSQSSEKPHWSAPEIGNDRWVFLWPFNWSFFFFVVQQIRYLSLDHWLRFEVTEAQKSTSCGQFTPIITSHSVFH